ncbi:MAG: hypothetical protein ACK4P4_02860 [Allorhizobium sp.]
MASNNTFTQPGDLASTSVKSKQLFVRDISLAQDGSHLIIDAGPLHEFGVASLSVLFHDVHYAKEMSAALIEAARRVNEKFGLQSLN